MGIAHLLFLAMGPPGHIDQLDFPLWAGTVLIPQPPPLSFKAAKAVTMHNRTTDAGWNRKQGLSKMNRA